MNEISCQICMDLIPLVQDGVASEDSVTAVRTHIHGCASCRSLYDGQLPVPSKHNILEKFRKKAQLFCTMLLMFGIFFGLSLTAGSNLFYNVLIMPLIGAIGYYLFQWRSVLHIPALLFTTHMITNAIGLGEEYLQLPSLLMWTGLYCIFALIGIVICALLHFALKKEG